MQWEGGPSGQPPSQQGSVLTAQPELLLIGCHVDWMLCDAAGELEALQGVMGSGEEGQVVSRLVSKVATLEAAAGQAEAQRRALHNQLVELRGNVSSLGSRNIVSTPSIVSVVQVLAWKCDFVWTYVYILEMYLDCLIA